MTFDPLVVGWSIGGYVILFFVIWWGIGILSHYNVSCNKAMCWGAFWPVLGLWEGLKALVWCLKWVVTLVLILRRASRDRKMALVARCGQQGHDYLTGLLYDDEAAYARGVYGIYPPAELEPPSEVR